MNWGWSHLVWFYQSHFGGHILDGVGDIQHAKMFHQKRKSATLAHFLECDKFTETPDARFQR